VEYILEKHYEVLFYKLEKEKYLKLAKANVNAKVKRYYRVKPKEAPRIKQTNRKMSYFNNDNLHRRLI
jgi:hypothetical protein